MVKRYVDDCLARNRSHFTINSVLRTLRTFFNQLASEGDLPHEFNPAQSVKKLKEPINMQRTNQSTPVPFVRGWQNSLTTAQNRHRQS